MADELEDISAIDDSDLEKPQITDQGDDELGPLSVKEQEELMLDQFALTGADVTEKKRCQLWTALPQRTRVAIRRLRRQFGHPAPSTLKNILKASKEDRSHASCHQSPVTIQ